MHPALGCVLRNGDIRARPIRKPSCAATAVSGNLVRALCAVAAGGALALVDVDVAVEHADLILNIGHDVVEKPPFFMNPNEQPVVIHLSFSPAETDAVYFPHAEVVGDIGNALWQIKEKLEPQPHWDHSFYQRCRECQEQMVFRGVHATASNFPMNIQRVVADLRQALEPSAIL